MEGNTCTQCDGAVTEGHSCGVEGSTCGQCDGAVTEGHSCGVEASSPADAPSTEAPATDEGQE